MTAEKMWKFHLYAFAAILVFIIGAAAQESSNIQKIPLSQAEINQIVKKFTANEGLFRQALNIYSFSRSATINSIGMGGQVTGTYRRDSSMIFAQDGTRTEKIEYAPVSTLQEITFTANDLENLGGIDPFAIEPSAIDKYNFNYLGKERIDELNLYVFDVVPKVIPDLKKGFRLFSGRVWVDDMDLLIVKSKGKAVPEGKNERFPVIETWRENVDGKYWFPSLSLANDELVFDNGMAVKIRVRVKYSNYKLARTDVRIIDEEDVKPEPTPTPKKP